VVGVEHADDVGIDDREGMVEVARLGVGIVGSGQVAGPELGGQLGDLGPVAVVQYPGLMLGFEGDRTGDGRQQDLGRLVVGCDQDGDLPWESRLVGRSVGIDVPQLEHIQGQPEQPVGVADEQQHGEPPPLRADREAQSPDQVWQGYGDGGNRHRSGDGRVARQGVAPRAVRRQAWPVALRIGAGVCVTLR
jgi:hypothetical protein